MIRVLIADDHAVVREGLRQIIAKQSDMAVTEEAASGPEVLNKIRDASYDVVLLDLSMPGRSGLEILGEIKRERPDLHVLILSVYAESLYAVRALKAGASGYLTKDSAPEQLVEAIRKVARGGKYISPTLAERLAYELESDSDKPPHEKLSDREYQVLCMLASGKTVKEIAEELSLSVPSISTYRARVLEKMNMKNNAELAHYAIRSGLVD
jgi:two-component system, NarL family, invasion response regulator UvrY